MLENNEIIFEIAYIPPDLDSDDDPEVLAETENGILYDLHKFILLFV